MAIHALDGELMKRVTCGVVRRRRRYESAQSMVEYALLLALISVAAIGALTALGDEISATFNMVAEQLSNAIP